MLSTPSRLHSEVLLVYVSKVTETLAESSTRRRSGRVI